MRIYLKVKRIYLLPDYYLEKNRIDSGNFLFKISYLVNLFCNKRTRNTTRNSPNIIWHYISLVGVLGIESHQ